MHNPYTLIIVYEETKYKDDFSIPVLFPPNNLSLPISDELT